MAIKSLLTLNIPAIKLGNSKSLPDMEIFLISPTFLRDRNRLSSEICLELEAFDKRFSIIH